MRLAALLLAAGAWAAPVSLVLSGQATADWLKIYPLAPYRETWAVAIEVKSMAKDLPRVMQVVEKRGGQLTAPMRNSVASMTGGTQQLMYRLNEKGATAALKDLRKIGLVPPPLVRPAGERAPLQEIKRKSEELSRDRREHSAELARMPAVSALVDAVLGHLVTAQVSAEKAETEVLLNITVEEKNPR